MIISLRHIEALRAVFLAGSVTGAAARLNITQPAVSHLIRDAEARLGYALFERQLGRLVPTRRATLLREQIEQSYFAFESFNDLCVRLRSFESRNIVVASIPTISTAILPWVFQRYLEDKKADNFFLVRPQETEAGIASARHHAVDIAFGVNLDPVPGVVCHDIGRFNAICFLPPGHPLQDKASVSPADLADLPFISMSMREGIGQRFESVMPQPTGGARAVVECASAITSAAMVEAGLGYTLLDPITAHIFRNSPIVMRRFESEFSFTLRAYLPDIPESHFDRDCLVALATIRAAEIGRLQPAR